MATDLRELKLSAGSWLRMAVLVAVATMLGGCLEYEQVVTVRADGSGTLRETTFIKGPMAAMMRSMNMEQESEEASAESAEGSLEVTTGTDDEQKARDRAAEFGEGVTFVSWEKISEDDREGGIAVYDFDDVTALRLGTGPPDMEESDAMELEDSEAMALEDEVEEEGDTEGISFRFERQRGKRVLVAVFDFEEAESEQTVPEEVESEPSTDEAGEEQMAEAMEDMAEGMADGMAEMMKPMLEGMRMRTVVEIEGEVLESDAPVEGSRVVLMDLDFDTIMANEDGMKKLTGLDDDASMGEAREVLSGLPGVVFPATDEVRITFR